MKFQQRTVSKSQQNMLTSSRFPRKRKFSRNELGNNYIIEDCAKQIGRVVSHRNPNNTSIVTFKFSDYPAEPTAKTSLPSKLQWGRRRNFHKDINMQTTLRPGMGNTNTASLRLASCEVRRLEGEPSPRKGTLKKLQAGIESDPRNEQLQVKGIQKLVGDTSSPYRSAVASRNGKLRTAIGSFRLKSQTNMLQMGLQSHSVEMVELMRKPMLRKDHFVFGLSRKGEGHENKMEIYRDFLWKVNYANRLFVGTPVSVENGYRAFVGSGNNSLMVKSILRRRMWWTLVERQAEANFVWTQLKVNQLFDVQQGEETPVELREIYCESSLKKLTRIVEADEASPADEYSRLFNPIDETNWRDHYSRNLKTECKIGESTYLKRVGLLSKKKLHRVKTCLQLQLQNHLPQSYHLGNKKALFYNMKRYYDFMGKDVFTVLPLTFHVRRPDDQNYQSFLLAYQRGQEERKVDKELRNVWIMKPGESTNRGNGISVCFGLDEVLLRLKSREKNADGSLRTFILQKYIERPLLYNGRKFDIRHYALVTCFAGSIRGYWYQHGYVRTSSSLFSLRNSKDLYVHLTNDAIQKQGEHYGRFQSGNKVSYDELQRYVFRCSRREGRAVSFMGEILPRMREITREAVRSSYHLLDCGRKLHNFELLGLDFMLDEQYRPLLIEVNTNPCLELNCPILEANTFRICVDPLFPPPENISANKKAFFTSENPLAENRFELIFDEIMDGPALEELFRDCEKVEEELGRIDEDDVVFENDGQQNWGAEGNV